VLADRLLNEYGLQTGFDPAPCDTVRWIQSGDAGTLARFVERNRSTVATDLDGAHVFLASSAFNLQWTAERNPEIRFIDIKTTAA
jgi:peptide chain release factor 3